MTHLLRPCPSRRERITLIAALFVVYFVWGSTFLAGRFAVGQLPPMTVTAIRALAAGLMLSMVRGSGPALPWRHAILPGLLLFTGGYGLLMLGMLTVPSGVAAVIDATIPMWLVGLAWLLGEGPRPTRRIVAGLAFGFLGVGLLAAPWSLLPGERLDVFGAAVISAAAATWALGTVLARHHGNTADPVNASARYLVAGGVTSALAALATGEFGRVELAAFTPATLGALAYLTLGGSLAGSLAYVWLMRRMEPATLSTHAFVNPVIATLLGALVAGEALTPQLGLAMATILFGVALILVRPTRRRARVHPTNKEIPMIARLWEGTVPRDRAADYVSYVEATGVIAHRTTPGNIASSVMTRDLGDGRVAVMVLSLWPDLQAIEAFAGPDPDTAVYYPEDEEYLLEMPDTVMHYEVEDLCWPGAAPA